MVKHHKTIGNQWCNQPKFLVAIISLRTHYLIQFEVPLQGFGTDMFHFIKSAAQLTIYERAKYLINSFDVCMHVQEQNSMVCFAGTRIIMAFRMVHGFWKRLVVSRCATVA